jgi:hypothetical protein
MAGSVGTVKPDGVTTEVSADGTLSAKIATQSTAGMAKGSTGITVGTGGALDVNTAFTQATELANIIAGEAIAQVLGKISKSIAVTMGLDQNALLKNMLTNIDANDQNKIPTAAFIHTLYDRIGMGTSLTAGANLTVVVESLNSNLTNVSNSLNTLKAKAPSDLAYINSFCTRINDFSNKTGISLIENITFIIYSKGIKSGCFGFSAVTYVERPNGTGEYGYVEFFKHADNYVTVKFYPETVDYFYIGRFVLGQSTWASPWRQI